jgi:hypothetical protein
MTRPTELRVAFGALSLAMAVVLGSALHLPARAADAYLHLVQPNGTCSSANPCLYWKNNSTGSALQGDSQRGAGVTGRTLSQINGGSAAAGVLGEDLAAREPNGSNMGVEGVSSVGIGVEGKSTLGPGVIALSNGGLAAVVATQSGNGDGVETQSPQHGTYSVTTNESLTTHQSFTGVAGLDASGDGGTANFGVWGNSINGTGVYGFSNTHIGVLAVGGGPSPTLVDAPALSIAAGPAGTADDLIDACSQNVDNPCGRGSASRVLQLDSSGNLRITGLLYSSGSCSVGCSGTTNGVHRRVVSYAPTQTVPSIEDFGQAQLANGAAYVRLSADFSNVIDRGATYLVFVTPEGDCNVLYVADKTASGFEVRESHGGKSTLAFDYRIVAKPIGAARTRLPVETLGARVSAAPRPQIRE